MKSIINSLPLSVQIIGSVAAVLVLVGAANLAYEISQQNASIEENAQKRGNAALDMLESVHVSAMLNRDKVADGDPAIGTLDGTMERFSSQSQGVDLWLVMGRRSSPSRNPKAPKKSRGRKTPSTKRRFRTNPHKSRSQATICASPAQSFWARARPPTRPAPPVTPPR
ncbi:hypothetical protein [Rhizobium sp. G21]|uniref:hypothetical protein n=1 Tax=Rhizobium sp. G21 TaxID=2758439 RepID=UPI0015FF568D|nr:hypothetical protein [Rhizobium sp. G21]MBB1248655.1 hypothetical protein [Rhizobium sp. G21]